MSGRKSKNKGKSYERELSKFLSETLGGSFVRVPYSGSYVGGKNIERTQVLSEDQTRGFKGDIIPPETLPKMVLEAKSYADFPFHQLLQGNSVLVLDDWIEQAKESCENNDVWFLCFKINRKGQYVAFPKEYLKSELVIKHFCEYKEYIITDLNYFFTQNTHKLIEMCT